MSKKSWPILSSKLLYIIKAGSGGWDGTYKGSEQNSGVFVFIIQGTFVNGKAFKEVFVSEDMVGHKLGEFSLTRLFRGHTNKKEGIQA